MSTSLMVGSRFSMASLVLGCVFVLGACGAAGVETEDGNNNNNNEEIGVVQEKITYGWTGWTGNVYGPINCDGSSLVAAIECAGSNCSRISAFCDTTSATSSDTYWTSPFSEEGSGMGFCSGNYWVSGISCTGNNCDNVSLRCTHMIGVSGTNCHWTQEVSEEGFGILWLGENWGRDYYALGARCTGNNCDNMSFLVCKMG